MSLRIASDAKSGSQNSAPDNPAGFRRHGDYDVRSALHRPLQLYRHLHSVPVRGGRDQQRANPATRVMAAILLSSVPFWLSCQNFWVAMSEGLAAGAFSPRQRVLIATTYAVAVLVTLLISMPYWKLVDRG